MKDIKKIKEAAEIFCKKTDEEFGEYWSNDYIELPVKMMEFAMSDVVKEYHQEGMYTEKEVFYLLHKLRMFIWEREAFSFKATTEWFNENKKK